MTALGVLEDVVCFFFQGEGFMFAVCFETVVVCWILKKFSQRPLAKEF